MSGIGVASGDDEPGFTTPGDADVFHTVSGRTARKNARASPHLVV